MLFLENENVDIWCWRPFTAANYKFLYKLHKHSNKRNQELSWRKWPIKSEKLQVNNCVNLKRDISYLLKRSHVKLHSHGEYEYFMSDRKKKSASRWNNFRGRWSEGALALAALLRAARLYPKKKSFPTHSLSNNKRGNKTWRSAIISVSIFAMALSSGVRPS